MHPSIPQSVKVRGSANQLRSELPTGFRSTLKTGFLSNPLVRKAPYHAYRFSCVDDCREP
jgi:hypothetical protein